MHGGTRYRVGMGMNWHGVMDIKEVSWLADRFAAMVGGGKLVMVDIQPEYCKQTYVL